MSFASDIKDIKRLVAILTGRDTEVLITYKGTSHGVVHPWHIRCDAREQAGTTEDIAANSLLITLKQELKDKIAFTEKQTSEYKKALGMVEN